MEHTLLAEVTYQLINMVSMLMDMLSLPNIHLNWPFEQAIDSDHFFIFMFCQLLRVQHSCSSIQSWGSVLLLRRETRIPRVSPFHFSNRNLGSFCA